MGILCRLRIQFMFYVMQIKKLNLERMCANIAIPLVTLMATNVEAVVGSIQIVINTMI